MVIHAGAKSRACFAFSVALAFAFGAAGAAENPATALEAPTVEVIGTTPIQGIGVPVSQVPANVQTTTGTDIQKQKTLDLSEYLENNLGSVTLNHGQNNPFQPDVNFRGLTASPLLGTPQGLSVFVDGVRVNEPFGDVVNWDLIPQNAISTITLIPGSNPVFGLNTLGAALSAPGAARPPRSSTALTATRRIFLLPATISTKTVGGSIRRAASRPYSPRRDGSGRIRTSMSR
jgi:outer membrane receptor protein involved in Fe transport